MLNLTEMIHTKSKIMTNMIITVVHHLILSLKPHKLIINLLKVNYKIQQKDIRIINKIHREY